MPLADRFQCIREHHTVAREMSRSLPGAIGHRITKGLKLTFGSCFTAFAEDSNMRVTWTERKCLGISEVRFRWNTKMVSSYSLPWGFHASSIPIFPLPWTLVPPQVTLLPTNLALVYPRKALSVPWITLTTFTCPTTVKYLWVSYHTCLTSAIPLKRQVILAINRVEDKCLRAREDGGRIFCQSFDRLME